MTLPVADPGFCCQLSRQADESIVATAAAQTGAFLILEVDAGWAPKAFEGLELPPDVRAHLQGWLDAVPGMRPQLIRRPGRHPSRRRVMLASALPEASGVVSWDIEAWEDLLQVDGPAVIGSIRTASAPGVGEIVQRPVVLVCTHGKRDRCCAKWGMPVFDALTRRDDIELWQTSHLGGHRFAATLLCLPQGICYGRVELDEANALVDAHLRGEVFRLDRLRGRMALPAVEQAAEHFVREQTGVLALDALGPRRVESLGDDRWRVHVQLAGQEHTVTIERIDTGHRAPGSCGKDPEPVRVFRRRS